mmetsp:Transcript_50259/g.144600  ORF Transcript_50259/g.144600 Transcript_50259/m.144600 type:complete len:262 (+) Transcript_50259:160-945(+)
MLANTRSRTVFTFQHKSTGSLLGSEPSLPPSTTQHHVVKKKSISSGSRDRTPRQGEMAASVGQALLQGALVLDGVEQTPGVEEDGAQPDSPPGRLASTGFLAGTLGGSGLRRDGDSRPGSSCSRPGSSFSRPGSSYSRPGSGASSRPRPPLLSPVALGASSGSFGGQTLLPGVAALDATGGGFGLSLGPCFGASAAFLEPMPTSPNELCYCSSFVRVPGASEQMLSLGPASGSPTMSSSMSSALLMATLSGAGNHLGDVML